jgi:hypothetical protein
MFRHLMQELGKAGGIEIPCHPHCPRHPYSDTASQCRSMRALVVVPGKKVQTADPMNGASSSHV